MIKVNICEAKIELSRLLNLVIAGEEVVIAKAGKPVARLIPVEPPRPASRFGLDKSDWKVPEDFNDPLPEEIVKAFWREV
ncbi:MAG TPA: type II toxin-antitoxin system prevent-host-death family antitoxin [Blastocatellia bacterium]|nr:type II toxin-antitoxin system prevent-host-death family antitoxin [Blastocatellia bacterium]